MMPHTVSLADQDLGAIFLPGAVMELDVFPHVF